MFWKKQYVSLLILSLVLSIVFSSCSSTTSVKEPDWIWNPYAKYDRQTSIAEVGHGSSREAAESNAFGKLVLNFDRSIQVDEKVAVSYREAVKNGVIAGSSEGIAVDSTVITTSNLNSLIGAEIGEVWDDGKGNIYAVAVLNKARTLRIYSDMIRSNQEMIGNLVTIPEAEKNTLEAVARYQLAATIADVTTSYGNVVSFIGSPVQGLKRGDDYRLEALGIAGEIPVEIRVRNDRSGRIEGSFAKALSDAGFRSGGNNSRYVLDVDIATTPVVIAGNQNLFTRIELKANLIDTIPGTVLLPFDFNSREGHITQDEADNRAYAAAARKINEDYPVLLGSYLYKGY